MTRVWTEREVRQLNEYIAQRWPTNEVAFNIRLGDIPDDIKRKYANDPIMLQTFRGGLPRADALVFDGGVVWIVEAKLEAEQSGAAQLTTYRMKLPQTPDFAERIKGKEIKTLLVCGRQSLIMKELCAELGHEFAVFSPPWVVEYLATRGIKRLNWR